MAMSEYKVIKIGRLQHFFAINDQPFLVFSQELLVYLPGARPAAAAEPVRQSHANSRRQQAEQPLAEFIAEYFFHEFITMISRSQAVSVAYEYFLPVEFECLRFVIDGDVQFLFKITAHPHVVVAGKKMNGDTGIRDLRHFPQDTGISFGYDGPVFIPEVEQVADDKDLRRILPDLFEECYDMPFPDQAGPVIGGAQVKIGEEIYFFSGGDLHHVKISIWDCPLINYVNDPPGTGRLP